MDAAATAELDVKKQAVDNAILALTTSLTAEEELEYVSNVYDDTQDVYGSYADFDITNFNVKDYYESQFGFAEWNFFMDLYYVNNAGSLGRFYKRIYTLLNALVEWAQSIANISNGVTGLDFTQNDVLGAAFPTDRLIY